jgi:hypothetical protein
MAALMSFTLLGRTHDAYSLWSRAFVNDKSGAAILLLLLPCTVTSRKFVEWNEKLYFSGYLSTPSDVLGVCSL